MSKRSNLWDAHPRNYKNNLLWDKLYHFLALRVRSWVYSAHLSLWQDQEEDIAEDIIQEAIIGALTYALEYSLEEDVFPGSLLQISLILAYQDYCQQEQRDARLIQSRPGAYRARGWSIMAHDEHVDWPEHIVASAFQEWFCECLAGTVMKIPLRPRVALLTHWANHLRVGSQQARILMRALSKRDIRLLEFQRVLSKDPREQRRYRALLRFAYRQILRKPEAERRIFLPGQASFAWRSLDSEEQIKPDRELIMLGTYLEATAPALLPALSFRETLRDKLLDIVVEYQIEQALTDSTRPRCAPTDSLEENESRDDSASLPISVAESEVEEDAINDTEIDMLTEFLKGMTPLAPVDPVFRATLREKLLALPSTYTEFSERKTVDDMLGLTPRFLEPMPQENNLFPNESENEQPGQISLSRSCQPDITHTAIKAYADQAKDDLTSHTAPDWEIH